MLTIRFRRLGKKDAPFYHLVVANSKDHVSKGSLEVLGYMDPIKKENKTIKTDRVSYWLAQGAKISERAYKFIRNDSAIVFPAHILKEFAKIQKSFELSQNKGISKKELNKK